MSQSDNDNSETETGSVGVITAVEYDGDMISVSEIDADQRQQFIDALTDELAATEGVADAYYTGGYSNKQCISVEILIKPRTPDRFERRGFGRLAAQPRSLAQQFRHILDKPYVSSYETVERPEPTPADNDDYKKPYYVIDINFV